MKKTHLQISFILLFICLISTFTNHANTLYDSLKRGIGTRPLSMGNAFTAIAENGAGTFYNPAGAASPGIFFQTENLDQRDTRFRSFTSQHITLSPFNYSKWETRTEREQTTIHSYTYGQANNGPIDWGITYKNVRHRTSDRHVNGWSSDIGVLMQLTPDLRSGITVKDVLQEGIDVATTAQGGLAWETLDRSLLLSGDIIYHNDDTSTLESAFGAEYLLTNGFSVRAGVHNDTLSLGGRLQVGWLALDYGSIIPTNGDDPTYMLSFGAGPGNKKQQTKEAKYALFKPSAYAIFGLSGNLIEGQSEFSLLGGQKIGSNDLLMLISDAANDETCHGFIIRIGQLSSSLGSIGIIQEIRDTLKNAKERGKTIHVYIDSWATLPEYYLASIADSITMPELGSISHMGIALEVTKIKKLLNNFGLDTQTIRSGDYKGALSSKSSTINVAERQQLDELVNTLYREVLLEIKHGRKLNWKDITSVFDGRLISAIQAKELGLIDHLGYWESVEKRVGIHKKSKDPKRAKSLIAFAKEPEEPNIFSPNNRIAVIEIDGPIHSGMSGSNIIFGGKSTGAEDINTIVDFILADSGIRGVVLRVNSPGGSLIASDKIYTSLLKLKDAKKPVYVSMGNIAASGGYYISLASDKIFANSNTLTGSIGVISQFDNSEKLNAILGIEKDVIKTGKFMDMLSGSRPLTDEEINMLSTFQEQQYRVFTNKLKKHRNISDSETDAIAQGQLFTGKVAKDLRLIDNIGSYHDTINALANDIGIIGEPNILVFRKQQPSLLDVIQGWL